MDFVVLVVLIVVALGAGSAFTWQQSQDAGPLRPRQAQGQVSALRLAAADDPQAVVQGRGDVGRLDLPSCGCKVDKYGRERAAA